VRATSKRIQKAKKIQAKVNNHKCKTLVKAPGVIHQVSGRDERDESGR